MLVSLAVEISGSYFYVCIIVFLQNDLRADACAEFNINLSFFGLAQASRASCGSRVVENRTSEWYNRSNCAKA